MAVRPSLPFPPLHLANRVLGLDGFGDDPYTAYESLGADTKAELLHLLPQDSSFAGRRVLDVGAARADAAALPRGGRVRRRVGVDSDAESIEWLERSLCTPLHAARCAPGPPLDLEAGTLNLVWAISVSRI